MLSRLKNLFLHLWEFKKVKICTEGWQSQVRVSATSCVLCQINHEWKLLVQGLVNKYYCYNRDFSIFLCQIVCPVVLSMSSILENSILLIFWMNLPLVVTSLVLFLFLFIALKIFACLWLFFIGCKHSESMVLDSVHFFTPTIWTVPGILLRSIYWMHLWNLMGPKIW